MTLQLVVNTGKVQVMTSGDLEDRVLQMLVHLERDHVKWIARGPEEAILSCSASLQEGSDTQRQLGRVPGVSKVQ